jgi:hypothetical protein
MNKMGGPRPLRGQLIDFAREAGDLPGSRIAMEHTFGSPLLEQRGRHAQGFLHLIDLLFLHLGKELLDLGPHHAPDTSVPRPSSFILPHALPSGQMVRHVPLLC